MKKFEKKVVLITGAASGIGLATAKKFFNEGADLILVDKTNFSKDGIASSFNERTLFIVGDLRDSKTLSQIEEAIKKQGVDVLINNAGIIRDSKILNQTDEMWNEVIDVNLTAVFKLSRLVLSYMKDSGMGCVLNAASVVAHYGNLGQANYTASKAAIIALTKTCAKEFGKYNIRVNAVAPGFIVTPMTDKMPENILEGMKGRTPLRRLGTPDDIANIYYFLASDEANFITGTTINVDGGLVI